jgi:signal transduction histidine kinase
MARSESSPVNRPSAVALWWTLLLTILALVVVVTWQVFGNAAAVVFGSGAVAVIAVWWTSARKAYVIAELRRAHSAEVAALRHRIELQQSETVRLARELLPAAVERLRHGAVAEEALSELAPAHRLGPELGAAHNAVLRSVIEAVEAQEGIHDSAQRAFVNIARRVQAIVHQQAQDLREMEDKHGSSPDFFDDLLHLDHGTALIGRLADSIAVLGGARPGRQWRQNVPLFNVLRGAMSRVTDYQRVDLHSVAEFAVAGPAVEPLIHALAELLDNATRYSPPQARVHLTAVEVHSGVAVDIEDAGVGLTEEARARAEVALAQASGGLDLDDLGESPRLGLAVVGRLSQAYGFKVALRPSAYGGVRAVLIVPKELITVTPIPGGQIARAASLPPPRASQVPAPAKTADEPDGGFSRNEYGLPQRRRGVPAHRGAHQAAPQAPRAEGAMRAPAPPGLWLGEFQEGISGRSVTGDAEHPKDE